MIRRLYVDNYRCFVNFELRLDDLTLLLGPNGVGKTSVLDVMFALRQLLSGQARVIDRTVLPWQSLTRWQQRDMQVIDLDVVLEGEQMRYRLEVEHERDSRRARIALERLDVSSGPLFLFRMGEVQLYRDNHSEGPTFSADWSESALARVPPRQDNTKLTRFLEFVRKLVICGLYPAGFDSEAAEADPVLERNGRNFPAWYQHLVLDRPDPDLIMALREVIDGFHKIRMPAVGLDTRAVLIQFDHGDGGQPYELRLDEISDGQRALIALYTLIRLAPEQGYTLLLDEPDNYVALAEIQPWLMELADAAGERVAQAVVCSHHPELIDYLGAERGILLERARSGPVTTRPLAEAAAGEGLSLSEQVARGWQR